MVGNAMAGISLSRLKITRYSGGIMIASESPGLMPASAQTQP